MKTGTEEIPQPPLRRTYYACEHPGCNFRTTSPVEATRHPARHTVPTAHTAPNGLGYYYFTSREEADAYVTAYNIRLDGAPQLVLTPVGWAGPGWYGIVLEDSLGDLHVLRAVWRLREAAMERRAECDVEIALIDALPGLPVLP